MTDQGIMTDEEMLICLRAIVEADDLKPGISLQEAGRIGAAAILEERAEKATP
ncbi:MAG: hypothetical protein OXF51_01830 [Alphaproteobacteria bacterium]|nr:hypothetical protein [Alphaproteobacteria bacterium]